MSRYPVQDEFTGQRARNVRSTVHPASLSDRSCNCLGTSGMLERKLNRVRQDGVRILKRTPKREGWGTAWGSSERTFGAPRPVLKSGLTQRDMKPEDPPRPPHRPEAVREMTFSAQHCTRRYH